MWRGKARIELDFPYIYVGCIFVFEWITWLKNPPFSINRANKSAKASKKVESGVQNRSWELLLDRLRRNCDCETLGCSELRRQKEEIERMLTADQERFESFREIPISPGSVSFHSFCLPITWDLYIVSCSEYGPGNGEHQSSEEQQRVNYFRWKVMVRKRVFL